MFMIASWADSGRFRASGMTKGIGTACSAHHDPQGPGAGQEDVFGGHTQAAEPMAERELSQHEESTPMTNHMTAH